MNKKEDYVTICPKCWSKDVSFEKDPAYVESGLINQFKECENCGHHGMVFPQVPSSKVPKKPKNIDEINDRILVQTSLGKGYFKYGLIFLPILILLYLLLF